MCEVIGQNGIAAWFRRINEDGGGGVATTGQARQCEPELAEGVAADNAAVDPVPVPHPEAQGLGADAGELAAQAAVADRHALSGQRDLSCIAPKLRPLLVAALHQHIFRTDELALIALLLIVGDEYADVPAILDQRGVQRGRRVGEGGLPVGQWRLDNLPAAGGKRLRRQRGRGRGRPGIHGNQDGARRQRNAQRQHGGQQQGGRQFAGRRIVRVACRRRQRGLRFAPAHADGEHDHDDHAKEHPAINQVIDADGDLVAGEVAEHDDEVGAHPVGDQRHHDGDADEDQAALQ